VHQWSDFHKLAVSLAQGTEGDRKPSRYCIRFRPSSGCLVLKITNDVKCIKFKSKQAVYLNRFELLSKSLATLMQNSARELPLSHSLPARTESTEPVAKVTAPKRKRPKKRK